MSINSYRVTIKIEKEFTANSEEDAKQKMYELFYDKGMYNDVEN